MREMKRAHIKIHGRVQGVFFRASARDTASKLGISGYVRNLRDGTVEAEAEGQEESVEKFIAWCRRGPPAANVLSVQVEWQEPTGDGSGFEIRY